MPHWWPKDGGRPDGRIRQGATVAVADLLDTASETELREFVREAAKRHRWKFYFTLRSDNSPKGYPDVTLCRPPRLILAELKKQGGLVSPQQREWLALLGRCPGVECFIWRPRDRDAIERILQGDAQGEPHGD